MESSNVFTIVIPVYNVIEYLSQCVQSVLSQEFYNYEIILVDDGSTDGSGERCDELARHDNRIRVIHQENQGLSAARNTGICAAGGKYVIFLDRINDKEPIYTKFWRFFESFVLKKYEKKNYYLRISFYFSI